jgi:predicted transcriptional regulator
MTQSEKKPKGAVISLRLGPNLHKEVQERAEKYNVTIPEVVRQAISYTFNVKEGLKKIPSVVE